MSFSEFKIVQWITEEVEEFAGYWRSLPVTDAIPRQSDFDPAAIRRLLPGIAIYEYRNENEFVCRLMGTGLVDVFGQDITDQNVLDMWGESDRDIASVMFRKMLEKPCGMVARTLGRTASGASIRSISAGFPLRDKNDIPNRLIFQTNNIEHFGSRIAREDKVERIEVEQQVLLSLL